MGRGSSSAGGGTGPFGGGMENGKDTTTRVLSSRPLTEVIGSGGGQYANEIMNTRDAMEREYGDAVTMMNLSLGKFSDSSVLGAYGDNTLYMAEKNVKNPYLTESMKQAAASGFHPQIGDKTGAEAVAAHEIGHRLGEIAAQKAGITEKQVVARAAVRARIRTENMAGYISGYARSNYSETIAEAASDVYCNGSKASKASRAIMREVKSILKQN